MSDPNPTAHSLPARTIYGWDSSTGKFVAIKVDSNGVLSVDPAVPTILLQGTRTTTAGSPVPIVAAATTVKTGVLVQADSDNTGSVMVGNSAAQPVELKAGDVVMIPIDDASKVYFDVTVNGEGISWLGA